MRQIWYDLAWDDYLYWEFQDKKNIKANQSIDS